VNRFNLSAWALRNRSLVVYLMIMAVVGGVIAFQQLGRNEDPPFTIRTMVVQVAWPGATLQETLLQVTERLERKLQEMEEVDSLRSYTKDGVTTVFVDLFSTVPADDVPAAWQRVRNSVQDIWHTLPQGVRGPFFNDRFGDVFGIIYGFTADGFTHRELRDYVEDIRAEILQVPDVSMVEILGAQDEQIFIEFSMRELATIGIDRRTLIAALVTQNAVRPAGEVLTSEETVTLRVSGAFESEQDILAVNFVTADGRVLPLSDIAQVRRGYSDPAQPMFRVGGEPAIGLAIAMHEGGDILALGQNIRETMARLTADLPLGIEPHLVADQPIVVDQAISEFMESLWQAIAIILAMSFISLGVRPGLVVAMAIPITLAIALAVMLAYGIDMQRISLGALIIALALLVDDAMTTTDATLTRLAAGDDKVTAAAYPFVQYAFPMLIGTLVTIAGFVPVGFAASSAGEYTFSLFAVVSIALVVSWFVALVFTPIINTAILRMPKAAGGDVKEARVTRIFRGFLSGAMRMRWLTIAATIGAFVVAILAFPLIPQQFFPSSDRPELVVDLRLPQSSSIYATEEVVERFDAVLADDPDIERWSTYVGRGAIRFYLPLDVQLANDFFAQSVIVARDVAARERLQRRLETVLTEDFPNIVARISPLELGPPVGWPIQFRVMGPEPGELRNIALDLAQVISAHPETRQINFDWIEPVREVRIEIDQDEVRWLGLNSADLAEILNTMLTGTTVTQVRDDIYLVNVVARATSEERVSLSALHTVQVPLPNGRTVPLSQFARFTYTQDLPLVWHHDRLPTLTVQADLTPGTLPAAVVDELQVHVDELAATLPAGYRIEAGGTVEESAESQASVAAVVPFMILITLTVLMFQLRSFARLFIVLSVAPLGLIGVVAALLGSGRPMGFVAILGILALFGIITKNAVILVGQIESERAAGKGFRDAVLDASAVRFRPIMLTALSTVFGMVPIAFTVFWGPMAVAIMGGLLVGTILTLVFLPTLYFTWFDLSEGRRARKTEKAEIAENANEAGAPA
jgi:multidrug efflux pump subunit AcrB